MATIIARERSMATIQYIAGDGVVVKLGSSELLIGRGRSADLRADEPTLSPRHARILPREGRYLIEDLHSDNGTSINGERLPARSSRVLANGDVVQCGRFRLQYWDD